MLDLHGVVRVQADEQELALVRGGALEWAVAEEVAQPGAWMGDVHALG
jgi:hypothetical protein